MSDAAVEERRLTLIRFEHAAGAAFGCEEEGAPSGSGRLLPGATTLALAALAAMLAGTITYLV